MALDKATLKQSIKAALQFEQNQNSNPNDSLDRIAQKLSDAFDVFVKSGTVTVASGITVSTTGTAAAQTGATTGTGTGTIN